MAPSDVSQSTAGNDGDDRISFLPDDILELILRRTDALTAARTCVLSTRWRHLWTRFFGDDVISTLPDDILGLILRRADALTSARTCILSTRWRHLWTRFLDLDFSWDAAPGHIRDAIDSYGHDIRLLRVQTVFACTESVAAWLPVAARHVVGSFVFFNSDWAWDLGAGAGAGAGAAIKDKRPVIELPCFERATTVYLDLGCLCLTVQPAGIFAHLTELHLKRARFPAKLRVTYDLGAVISRCPCLRTLRVLDSLGLEQLHIKSESLVRLELRALDTHGLSIVGPSLLQVELINLRHIWSTAITAPSLLHLRVVQCICYPMAVLQGIGCRFSAPRLEHLEWIGLYDSELVHLGEKNQIKWLETKFFVYGSDDISIYYSGSCLNLLQHFKAVERLVIRLCCPEVLDESEYLMHHMKTLPHIQTLHLMVYPAGHDLGGGVFHILSLCSSITALIVESNGIQDCNLDCTCGQQAPWKTEDIYLKDLEYVEIIGLGLSQCEVSFMKKLLKSAPKLTKLQITFADSVTQTMVTEFSNTSKSFCRPDIGWELYIIEDLGKVLYVPEER